MATEMWPAPRDHNEVGRSDEELSLCCLEAASVPSEDEGVVISTYLTAKEALSQGQAYTVGWLVPKQLATNLSASMLPLDQANRTPAVAAQSSTEGPVPARLNVLEHLDSQLLPDNRDRLLEFARNYRLDLVTHSGPNIRSFNQERIEQFAEFATRAGVDFDGYKLTGYDMLTIIGGIYQPVIEQFPSSYADQDYPDYMHAVAKDVDLLFEYFTSSTDAKALKKLAELKNVSNVVFHQLRQQLVRKFATRVRQYEGKAGDQTPQTKHPKNIAQLMPEGESNNEQVPLSVSMILRSEVNTEAQEGIDRITKLVEASDKRVPWNFGAHMHAQTLLKHIYSDRAAEIEAMSMGDAMLTIQNLAVAYLTAVDMLTYREGALDSAIERLLWAVHYAGGSDTSQSFLAVGIESYDRHAGHNYRDKLERRIRSLGKKDGDLLDRQFVVGKIPIDSPVNVASAMSRETLFRLSTYFENNDDLDLNTGMKIVLTRVLSAGESTLLLERLRPEQQVRVALTLLQAYKLKKPTQSGYSQSRYDSIEDVVECAAMHMAGNDIADIARDQSSYWYTINRRMIDFYTTLSTYPEGELLSCINSMVTLSPAEPGLIETTGPGVEELPEILLIDSKQIAARVIHKAVGRGQLKAMLTSVPPYDMRRVVELEPLSAEIIEAVSGAQVPELTVEEDGSGIDITDNSPKATEYGNVARSFSRQAIIKLIANEGLCRGYTTDIFSSPEPAKQRIAKSICEKCLIRVECLDYAERSNEHGVWGGVVFD